MHTQNYLSTCGMSELTIDLPVDITLQEARFLLATKLFEIGRLSLGQAAELADYSKATFMELLDKVWIPVFDYPAEDLEKEMNL